MIDLTDQDLLELASAGVMLASLPAIRKILARHNAAFAAGAKRAKDAERARAYRERQKEARPPPSRDHHAAVTVGDKKSPEPSLNLGSDSERDSREGKKEIQIAREARRGSRLPENFIPDATVETIARERQFSRRDWHDWLAGFLDYWRGVPGQRGVKLDWQATARNSIRSHRLKGNGNGTNSRPALRDEFSAALDLIDAKYGTGETGGGSNILQLPGLRQGT